MRFLTTKRIALNSFSNSASLCMAGAYFARTTISRKNWSVSQIVFGRSVDPGDLPRRWSLARNLFSSTLRFRISSDWLIGWKSLPESVKSSTYNSTTTQCFKFLTSAFARYWKSKNYLRRKFLIKVSALKDERVFVSSDCLGQIEFPPQLNNHAIF